MRRMLQVLKKKGKMFSRDEAKGVEFN